MAAAAIPNLCTIVINYPLINGDLQNRSIYVFIATKYAEWKPIVLFWMFRISHLPAARHGCPFSIYHIGDGLYGAAGFPGGMEPGDGDEDFIQE